MLFIKYISDKYGDSDGFAPVTIPPGASFKDMVAIKSKSDIGDKINTQVIQPLIDANSRLARSDFPDFNDPNKLGEGYAMVKRLENLIGIFENPALDFSKNRSEHDDILGDAYDYLMRHFACQSGKSKGRRFIHTGLISCKSPNLQICYAAEERDNNGSLLGKDNSGRETRYFRFRPYGKCGLCGALYR